MDATATGGTSLWRAYIGLGGNLPLRLSGKNSPPQQTVLAAAQALAELGTVEAVSGLWQTAPVGPVRDQPDFVNAAAQLRTQLAPETLLERLLAIEQRFGRVRGPIDKGSRTLDLDLLLMERIGEPPAEPGCGVPVVLDTPRLQLPHPEMHRRRFVLAPLTEIAPDVRHPLCDSTVRELLLGLDAHQPVKRLGQQG